MSFPERKSKIPDPPAPAAEIGNLLSSVPPPAQLPNFITVASAVPQVNVPSTPQPVQPVLVQHQLESQLEKKESFSPAIPLSKGEPLLSIRSPEDSQATHSPESQPDLSLETDKIGDVMPGSGLLTWVKGAVSSGGILQRVAEKAKSSVDSMITTLDPQMKEYLRSGGDMYVVVASDKDVKISPIREAFQNVFGKATVVGFPSQSDVTAAQPVGYAAAYAAAKQRIAQIRSTRTELNNNIPVVAVESFLHESITDRWYSVDVLVLTQPSLGIEVQMQSQGCPVPSAAVAACVAATPPDYPHAQTGYSLTVGAVVADSLHVERGAWQAAATGVTRAATVALAARALAGAYCRLLDAAADS